MPNNNPNQADLEALADRLGKMSNRVGVRSKDTKDLRLAARCVLAWAKVEKHCDNLSYIGSGAADDKWWRYLHNDGNLSEGGTALAAVESAE